MKRMTLDSRVDAESQIFVGKRLSSEVKKYLKQQAATTTVYVTDSNLRPLLKKYLNPPQVDVFLLSAGEEQKSLDNLAKLIEFMLSRGAAKTSLIVGFGGGVVTDLAGLAGSVFNRGIATVLIPTSLVGMVDAAVGGKNGVDFGGVKNLIGTITQPRAVFVDITLLDSLPRADFLSGLGEIARYAICLDSKLFSLLFERPLEQNLEKIIEMSIKNKIQIVEADPLETSSRRWLMNFGHTLGHGLESYSKFKLKHGIAVGIGCHFAAFVSWQKRLISAADYHRIVALLQKLELPLNTEFSVTAVMKFIKQDKKKASANSINFVLTRGIGRGFTEQLKFSEIQSHLQKFSQLR